MPTVGVNIPAESFCDAAIGVDNYDGMSKAVRLLKSLGHQRIAFVVDYIPDDMVYSTSQRMEAFLEAAEQNGYDDEYAYVITADEHDAPLSKADLAAQLVAKLLSLPHMPTAICAETDQVAIAVIKELGKQQLHVPEDISVIGFDDADIAQAANLTTVRQNPLEMGRNAARKTLSLLRGQTPDASYESQEATLMLRDTTERTRGDRPFVTVLPYSPNGMNAIWKDMGPCRLCASHDAWKETGLRKTGDGVVEPYEDIERHSAGHGQNQRKQRKVNENEERDARGHAMGQEPCEEHRNRQARTHHAGHWIHL